MSASAERGDASLAGFVLAGASLVVPPSAVAAIVVGAVAAARGRVIAGAAIVWLAAVLGTVGGLIWYDALDLAELLFYPDLDRPRSPRPIPGIE